jgi:hypothetical protein
MNKVIRYAGCFAWPIAAALILGCAGPKVKRTEVDETIDLSGRWNDTDSRLVAEEMIQDCLSRHKQIVEKLDFGTVTTKPGETRFFTFCTTK